MVNLTGGDGYGDGSPRRRADEFDEEGTPPPSPSPFPFPYSPRS